VITFSVFVLLTYIFASPARFTVKNSMAKETLSDYKQIMKDLQNKQYRPLYFLHGEEAYFIDAISDHIEQNLLSDAEKGFNQSIFYGKDSDVNSIVMAARRYPMMAQHQVIIVKEAQHLKDLDSLLPYLANPLQSTVLVFCYKYKKIDKRTKLSKMLDKFMVFDSDKLYENQVPAWVEEYVGRHKRKINLKAAGLMTEYLGTELSKMANELDKLFLNVPEGKEINLDDIEKNIGISKDYNIFELQTAIAGRNFPRAMQIVYYFQANPKSNPFVMMLGTFYSYFSKIYAIHYLADKSKMSIASSLKINPFFADEYIKAVKNYPLPKVEEIFGLLKYYDLRSKGIGDSGTEDGELLKEMVSRIMT
jgi:DNA polymerase-3 subunit delta